jgi:hypothetical protein
MCGQNCPLNSPDLKPFDYFLWGSFKEIIFLKKAAKNNGIYSTNHSGLQRDNSEYMPSSNQQITVHVEEAEKT